MPSARQKRATAPAEGAETGARVHSGWEFVFRYDPAKHGQNGPHRNAFAVNAERKSARDLGFLMWQKAGCPKPHGPVRVHVRRYGARLLDEASVWSGLKGLMDGLFTGLCWYEKGPDGQKRRCTVPGMLPDDSPAWLRLGEVTQEHGPRWGGRNATVVLTVEPLTATEAARRAEKRAREEETG